MIARSVSDDKTEAGALFMLAELTVYGCVMQVERQKVSSSKGKLFGGLVQWPEDSQ